MCELETCIIDEVMFKQQSASEAQRVCRHVCLCCRSRVTYGLLVAKHTRVSPEPHLQGVFKRATGVSRSVQDGQPGNLACTRTCAVVAVVVVRDRRSLFRLRANLGSKSHADVLARARNGIASGCADSCVQGRGCSGQNCHLRFGALTGSVGCPPIHEGANL